MKMICILLSLGFLFKTVISAGTFCSDICKPNSCNGFTVNNCTGCSTNWLLNGTTCTPNSASNWQLIDTSTDIPGGTLSFSGVSTTISNCGPTFYGWLSSGSIISITHPGIAVPFFQMQMYIFTLLKDGLVWTGNSAFTLDLNAGYHQKVVMKGLSVTRQKYCGDNSKDEYYIQMNQLYNYNASTALTWTLSNNQTKPTSQWGVKQFILIARYCHPYCTSCYGTIKTNCWSCSSVGPYLLSNNTCGLTCLSQFGITADPAVCIYCDLHCKACTYSFDNCSACTTSGIWSSYLDYTTDPSYMTCNLTCLIGFFKNQATHKCDPCNVNCSECINSLNYCTNCISGFAWFSWTCYSPCPTGFYLESNLTNCTKCSLFCQTCGSSSTNCSVCTLNGPYIAYLSDAIGGYGTCNRTCVSGFYSERYGGLGPNTCLACNASCATCSNNPSPCYSCNTGYYFYLNQCINPCPSDTFAYDPTGTCLTTAIYGVKLTINMYFPDNLNQEIYVNMSFSQIMDWITFDYANFQTISITSLNIPYDLTMFNTSYQTLNDLSYRIILKPKGYIFLYNATFTVTTIVQPVIAHTSKLGYPFRSSNYLQTSNLTWFLIKGPPFSDFQSTVMNTFSNGSTRINNFLAIPGIQEIRKSGILSMIFSGAQITSCSMLQNSIQSQNFYEGVRFWAVFIFFDAPKYEANSQNTKLFVSPTIQNLIRNAQQIDKTEISLQQRQLFSTDSMFWRFQRTGYTSFFIYDCYVQMVMIVICWGCVLLSKCFKNKSWLHRYQSSVYSFTHKFHEVSIMYFTMASIIEFMYFTPTSFDRIISALICIVFNIYFIIYELYLYYDMIKYPLAQIGNQTYQYFVTRYGGMLKNIRHLEYQITEEWSPKQWFRPYNYHILSYYKKFIMMISLPLFYNIPYAQIGVLASIQLLEIIRFLVIWPFSSKRRNFFRLSLELSLLLFFAVNLYQTYLLNILMQNDPNTIAQTAALFYGIGWLGLSLCFYFNCGCILAGLYDLLRGCVRSNRELMDSARKKYYFSKLKSFEKTNEWISDKDINKWVRLGNLNDRQYGELPNVNVRVEYYRIYKSSDTYSIEIKRLFSLFMNNISNYRNKDNTSIGKKVNKKININQSENSQLFSIIDKTYKKFQSTSLQYLIIKTFQNVRQKDYQEGEEIKLVAEEMFQKVEMQSFTGEIQIEHQKELLLDFPISQELLCTI